MISSATAEAHPNIALVKYWGKEDDVLNIPSSPSLSLTIDRLSAHTRVLPGSDSFLLNGELVQDPKTRAWTDRIRRELHLPAFGIESSTNFPVGSGLASSAAGFAALVTAVDSAFDLGMSCAERSRWARLGSASAARSIFGGFCALEPRDGDCETSALFGRSHWDLEVVVAVTSRRRKAVSSTDGMVRCKETSPYFASWLQSCGEDFAAMRPAVASKDFEQVGEIAESNCLRMHAVMMGAVPPLVYWNATTLAVIDSLVLLREAGIRVFYTIDAGPQVKAVCADGSGAFVRERLRKVPGVLEAVLCRVGEGARVKDN